MYLDRLRAGADLQDVLMDIWHDGRLLSITSAFEVPKRKKKRRVGALPKEEWRKLRYRALLAANGRCQCCGATAESSGAPLHVDHIKPKSLFPELALEFSNLQVLCKDCNFGKHQWDQTDWRWPPSGSST